VPIYTRIMPLFVHAVYRGDNFYTHVSAPVQMKSVAGGAGSAKIYCATRTADLGQ
jgi:replication-associated recombination protein RarA